MHYSSSRIEARLRRFRTECVRPAFHRGRVALQLTSWEVPDEPVPFAEAVRNPFTPFSAGSEWGRPWGTVWFRATGSVPSDWRAVAGTSAELVVDLGFNDALPGFQAEATVYSPDGRIIKAIEPMNRSVTLEDVVGGDGVVDLFIEAAANPRTKLRDLFAPTPYGDKATAGRRPIYRLGRVDVALLDHQVWEFEQDCAALVGLLEQLPESSQRRAGILQALDRAVDVMDPDDISGTAAQGRAVLEPVLSRPASASAHRVHAVGHAHIDSAWLWPTRETVRKVARTFSNVCDLIDSHPDFVFAASSAQQYSWLKEFHPELFERVREKVRSGNFVPVGGMWVESDTNLPGGEALARQFLAGKTFFLREFGIDTEEVWLPDSFGYSAALPQIAVAAGSRWFLTQKISWNETNPMPHHTFHWEGIDGTQIFTHFPPVDTYNSDLGAADLARAEGQYAEKGIGTTSLVPFGYGDGGGGPTREMLAAAARTRSLEGSPTVSLSSPRAFFEDAESEYPQPPVWSGELYLEFHRGTYTSQARTKRGNRRSEHLLREAELWATTAAVRVGAPYPAAALERIWHTVLLQQFHDILPGTSIAWVHQEAERNYAAVAAELESIIRCAVTALLGEGGDSVSLNAGPYPVAGVPALGACRTAPPARPDNSVEQVDGGFVCDNGRVRLRVDDAGLIRSMVDLRAERELLPEGRPANLLQLHRDTPTQWDAWDIDDHYRRSTVDLDTAVSVGIERRADRAVLVIHREFGASTVVQTLSLEPGSPTVSIRTDIDWHERKKLLKLAFPFDLHAERAASEIQFGHVHRPTHANTSWDAARFETVAHRWVHVGEADYGVAVANDATYGHDITRARNGSRDTATTVRLSLLRAPVFPDPRADRGKHTMNVALRLGATIADAVREGYRLNLPVRTVAGVRDTELRPLLTVSNPAIVVEAVKTAEDGSGDVVVRLYEALGTRARGAVRADFPTASVTETDLMERSVPPAAVTAVQGNIAHLELRPFQLSTLRFSPEAR